MKGANLQIKSCSVKKKVKMTPYVGQLVLLILVGAGVALLPPALTFVNERPLAPDLVHVRVKLGAPIADLAKEPFRAAARADGVVDVDVVVFRIHRLLHEPGAGAGSGYG